MGTSPLVGQYDNLQDSQSGKTVDGFSLPPACIAPSDAMKINQRKKKVSSSVSGWFLCVLYPKYVTC